MKILFSANTFFPQQGGAEQLTADLIQYCQKEGHETFLITQLLDKSLAKIEQQDRLEIYRVEFPRRHLFGKKGKRKNIKRIWRLFFYHYRLLKKEKIETFYVSHFGMNGLFPVLLKAVCKFRFVVLLHASELRVHYKNYPLFRFVLRLGLYLSDEIICVSDKLRDELITIMPKLRSKVRVISNAVPKAEMLSVSPYEHPHPFILFVGRLSYQKNIPLLIEAFSRISNEIGDCDLVIVGDGPEENSLRELLKAKNIQDRVHLFGSRSRREVFSIVRACSLVVLPSHNEGHPLVALEAIAAGKICIGSAVKGISEVIVDKENGLLFKAGDADELSSLMLEYLPSSEKKQTLESKIIKASESLVFDFNYMLKKHMQVIVGEKDFVTIIMPCKDADVSLMREAVSSVLRQTESAWSLLIVDDHSSNPETLRYLKELDENIDPRVVVCKNDSKNITGALNTALKKAKTPFVAMLHCDDLLSRHTTGHLNQYIKNYPNVDYFHSSRRVIDDNGRFISGVKKSKKDISRDAFINGGQVKHLHCYRVSKALSVGGMDENLGAHGADDYDFPWVMHEEGAVFKAIPECLYYYRDHRLHERLTTHVPLAVQVDELKKIFLKHKLSHEQIEAQIERRKSSYLQQALFLDERDKAKKEQSGLCARDGWRESY